MMDAGQRGRGRGVSEGCDGSQPLEDGEEQRTSHSISSSVRLCALTIRYGGKTNSTETQSQHRRKCKKNVTTLQSNRENLTISIWRQESNSKHVHVYTHPQVNSVEISNRPIRQQRKENNRNSKTQSNTVVEECPFLLWHHKGHPPPLPHRSWITRHLCPARNLSQWERKCFWKLTKHARMHSFPLKIDASVYMPITLDSYTHLADGGQFGEQHLEDGWWQGLLQHLQQLLRLAAHGDGVGQVIHAPLIVSCRTERSVNNVRRSNMGEKRRRRRSRR